ncbi:ACT domain-containing protein [Shimia sp. W99]|uniref:DUF2241 domain-containing protein n=1 Tax=Shimia aestuarii TaxID=254406 RepID=A0A1I4JDU6_9RHOB|nr:ACT domain-containing protein [Shimia aestuarii]SFL64765.1 hypothetical protein SAMN04488042_101986 [Shimia aestuarii]
MSQRAHTAHEMISGMSPEPMDGTYVFVTTTDTELATVLTENALALYRETEGISLIIPVSVAAEAGFAVDQPMRCITLNVYSALDGVGLTAAVATELAAVGIPCNMVAAYNHDHVFVPETLLERALASLQVLQSRAQQGC